MTHESSVLECYFQYCVYQIFEETGAGIAEMPIIACGIEVAFVDGGGGLKMEHVHGYPV